MNSKKIELKDLINEQFNIKTTYKEMIMQILATPISGGADYNEMRVVMPIMDKVDDADENVFLTQQEWEYLKARAEKFKFRFICREIKEFIESINDAQDIKMAPVEAEVEKKAN